MIAKTKKIVARNSKKNKELKENTEHIASLYLKSLEGQEMHPLGSNMSIFGTANSWNTRKFYGKHYKDALSFSAIVLLKGSKSISNLSGTKIQSIAREVFRDYWQDHNSFLDRIKKFEKIESELSNLYSSMTFSHIAKSSEAKVCAEVEQMHNLMWEGNAIMLCSVIFDKEFCNEMITSLKIPITNLDSIWDKAITPISDSFEKRGQLFFLRLLKQGMPWQDIVEQCQYIKTGYPKIFQLKEIELALKDMPAKTPAQAKKALDDYEAEKKKQLAEYDRWLSGLTKTEQELVNYIQYIIEFRDRRKDLIGKGLTSVYRAAQRFFSEAGIPEELIMYSDANEISKGTAFLKKNKKEIIERKDGYGVFVDYEGNNYHEHGNFEENKLLLEKAYLNQEKKSNNDELTGQTGSPGKATGKVKLIMNIVADAKQFNKGDILVSGATRPEFVPLMRKAGAVVTDEGGVTSHAAIVCRELGIPCLIGARIATRMLKDGDIVEVDADKGVVRKLS